jgi:hypothetical protein
MFQVAQNASFKCLSKSYCPEGGVHKVAGLGNASIFTEVTDQQQVELPPGESERCSYTLFDHIYSIQKAGAKLDTSHIYCSGCNKVIEKPAREKCKCGSNVLRNIAWTITALGIGFHELFEEAEDTSDPEQPLVILEDWLNEVAAGLMSLLMRGESYSYGKEPDKSMISCDYFDSIFKLSYQEVKLMMPLTRKHEQCTPEVCISRDVYCPGWKGNNYDVNPSNVPERSAMEESMDDYLTLSTEDRLSDSDTPHSERSVSNVSRDLLADQQTHDTVTAPSLVTIDRELLNQMSNSIIKLVRDNANTNVQLRKLTEDVKSLKRKGVHEATGSAPKLQRSNPLEAAKEKPAVLSCSTASGVDNTAASTNTEVTVELLQPSNEETEDPCVELPELRGTSSLPSRLMDSRIFHVWGKKTSQASFKRGKLLPKLERMGLPMEHLEGLNSNMLSEVFCLFCKILWNKGAQRQGVPDYMPKCYMSEQLTTKLCLEKLAFLSPLIHSLIMAKVDFFSVDRMAVNPQFYMLPVSARDARRALDRQAAKNSSVVPKQGPGSRSSTGDSAAQRQPTLSMATDKPIIPDLRNRITGNRRDTNIVPDLGPSLTLKPVSSGAGSSACTTQRPPSPAKPEVVLSKNLKPREDQAYDNGGFDYDIRNFMKRVPEEEVKRYLGVMEKARIAKNDSWKEREKIARKSEWKAGKTGWSRPCSDIPRPAARKAKADKGAGWGSVASSSHRRPSPPPRRSPSCRKPPTPPRRSPSRRRPSPATPRTPRRASPPPSCRRPSTPPRRTPSHSPPRLRAGDRARSRTLSHHHSAQHMSPRHSSHRGRDSRQDRDLPSIPGLHRSQPKSVRPATLLSREFTPQPVTPTHCQRHSRHSKRDSRSPEWETVERRTRSRRRSPSREEKRD